MKRIILLLAIIAFATSIYSQESYTYSFSESDFTIKYSGDTVRIVPTSSTYDNTFEVGQPQLPLVSKRILNPSGKYVSDFTVTVTKRVIATDVVMPGVEKPKIAGEETVTESTIANKSFMTPVLLNDGDCRHHGYSYSAWEIAPFLYNAFTHELFFVDSVSLFPLRSVTADNGSLTIRPRPDLMDWTGFENNQAQSTYAFSTTHTLGLAPGEERIDYLIVTADSLKEAFMPLLRLKKLKGLHAKIETIEEILQMPCEYTLPQEKLKWHLYKRYQNNGLKWCLLGGDERIVPVCSCYVNIKNLKPHYHYFPSDRYFACFEKNFRWDANNNGKYGEYSNEISLNDNIDISSEIYLSRLPMHTKQQIYDWTNKYLTYVLNPPRDIDISKIFMAGYRLDSLHSAYTVMSRIQEILETDYNITCDMLFDDYSNIAGADSINLQNFIPQMNKSYNVVGIYTHGDETRYHAGPPELNSYNTDLAIHQSNRLAGLMAAFSCNTNNITAAAEPCLSEAFLRNPTGGAIAYFGWASVAYTSIGDVMIRSFLSSIYAERSSINCFSRFVDDIVNNMTLTEYKERTSTILGLNIMGDPQMSFYPGRYKDLDISFEGNKVILPIKKDPLLSGILYGYINTADSSINGYKLCRRTEYNAYCELPSSSYNAIFYGTTYVPVILLNRQGETYTLNNINIDYNLVIRANKVIVGENVTIKPYARLKIFVTDEVELQSNIECQTNGKFEISYE